MQGWPSRYAYTAPGDLSLKLIFDGTGVNKIGLERLINPPSAISNAPPQIQLAKGLT